MPVLVNKYVANMYQNSFVVAKITHKGWFLGKRRRDFAVFLF
tara:strand:+ start:106 stop:231 length:126 start_codon:yes stop_codon:yes gene_type:complete